MDPDQTRVAAGCSWVLPLYLSDAAINALRAAQVTNPEVRDDRVAIAGHNRNYEENCAP